MGQFQAYFETIWEVIITNLNVFLNVFNTASFYYFQLSLISQKVTNSSVNESTKKNIDGLVGIQTWKVQMKPQSYLGKLVLLNFCFAKNYLVSFEAWVFYFIQLFIIDVIFSEMNFCFNSGWRTNAGEGEEFVESSSCSVANFCQVQHQVCAKIIKSHTIFHQLNFLNGSPPASFWSLQRSIQF